MKKPRAALLGLMLGLALTLSACGGAAGAINASTSSPEFLYLGTFITSTVVGFQIDLNGGALTSVGSAAAPVNGSSAGDPCAGPVCGGTFKQLVADPLGRFLYYLGANTLTVFQVNSNGALSTASTAAAAIAAIGADPQGRFLYAIQPAAPPAPPALLAYQIGSNGLLTLVGTPAPLPANAGSVAVAGSFVYVAAFTNPGNALAEFAIQSDGSVAPLAGSPLAISGTGAVGSAVADPQGRFLYLTQVYFPGVIGQYQVLGYAVDARSGQLTPVPGSPFPTGNSSTGTLVIAPNSVFLYAYGSNGVGMPNLVEAYAINSAGSLSLSAQASIGGYETVLAVDRLTRYAYAVISGNQINAYGVNSSTGALTPLGVAPVTAAITSPDFASGAAVLPR